MPRSIARGSSRTPIWFLCAAPWFSSTLFGSWDTCVHAAALERCPDARTQATMLSACSGSCESLQFGAAFLTESTQRIYRVAADQLSQLRKRLVGREIRIDNHANHRLRLFDHGRARHDTHSADQRVNADQRRNL